MSWKKAESLQAKGEKKKRGSWGRGPRNSETFDIKEATVYAQMKENEKDFE